jgi:hypothetical protein
LLPSKDPDPVTSPVKEMVLAVANLVAVLALPIKLASKLALLVPSYFFR